jgi:hypothetical protein
LTGPAGGDDRAGRIVGEWTSRRRRSAPRRCRSLPLQAAPAEL